MPPPFTVSVPGSVAVDTTGNVYVLDGVNHQILKLAAGSSTQTVLPFGPLRTVFDVAVDSAGNVYVSGTRIVELPAGSSTPKVLWSSDHSRAASLTVDAIGNLYFDEALSEGTGRVLKLPVQ
jgi:serine/threonine-protein kinase